MGRTTAWKKEKSKAAGQGWGHVGWRLRGATAQFNSRELCPTLQAGSFFMRSPVRPPVCAAPGAMISTNGVKRRAMPGRWKRVGQKTQVPPTRQTDICSRRARRARLKHLADGLRTQLSMTHPCANTRIGTVAHTVPAPAAAGPRPSWQTARQRRRRRRAHRRPAARRTSRARAWQAGPATLC